MTYNNIYGQSQNLSYVPVSGPANPVFQPGFAGTNVQEVRQDYALSQQTPAVTSTYSTSNWGTPVNSVFTPGFAGTNVQEVRALNAGYGAPGIASQQLGTGFNQVGMNPSYGYTPQYSSVGVPSYTASVSVPATVNSVFQPGFAGTNVQEVRARNNSGWNTGGLGYTTGAINSVFSPNFAGTNVQEVRSLNAGYSSPGIASQQLGTGYNVGQNQGVTSMGISSGIGQAPNINAIFQPGFAGTNPQEVRQDYALSQQSVPYGIGYTNIPYRTY